MPTPAQISQCCDDVYDILGVRNGFLAPAYHQFIAMMCGFGQDPWLIAVLIMALRSRAKREYEIDELTPQDAADALGPRKGLSASNVKQLIELCWHRDVWRRLLARVQVLWRAMYGRSMSDSEIETLWGVFLDDPTIPEELALKKLPRPLSGPSP